MKPFRGRTAGAAAPGVGKGVPGPPHGGLGTALLFGALVASIFVGGALFYRAQARSATARAERELDAVARLKVQQLDAWRRDLLLDARILQEHRFLVAEADRYIASPSPRTGGPLEERLALLARQHDLCAIHLLDAEGRRRLTAAGGEGEGEGEEGERGAPDLGVDAAAVEAARGRAPVLVDLHVSEQRTAPHMAVVAPIFDGGPQGGRRVGALVMVVDAARYLFPLLQSWPTASDSAETLLVRKEGDQVLFLNDLRHAPGAALKLRIPLGQEAHSEVQAGLGREGIFEGLDYRGVRVLSVVRAIPDSDWVMVAKIDAAEVFDAWRDQSVLIVALVLVAALLAAALGLAARQRESRRQFQALLREEVAQRAGLERYRTTLLAIDDGVMLTGPDGRVELVNPVMELLTGWDGRAALGRPAAEVVRVVHEQTRARMELPISQALCEGRGMGLGPNALLLARDGRELPVTLTAAPITGLTAGAEGAVLVLRDQSGERRLQRYGRMLEEALDEVYVFDARTLSLVDANRAARRNLGYTLEELRELTPVDLKAPMTRAEFEAHLAPLRRGERDRVAFAATHRRKDGSTYPVEVQVQLHAGEAPLFAAFVHDVTERQQALEALRASEENFRRLFEWHAAVMLLIDPRTGEILEANHSATRFYGWAREELVGKRIGEINTLPPERMAEELERARTQGRTFFEFRHQGADGSIRDVEIYTTRIELTGREVLHSIIHDVSARKRTEAELTQVRAAVEQAGEAVVVTDPEGRIVFANPAFEQATGYRLEEVLGQTPRILKSGVQDRAFYGRLWAAITAGETFKARMVNRRKDGSLFTEEATISPVRAADGRIANFVAVKRDITEALRLEAALQQAQKMESIGRLAGGVAHDYNNVLGVIQGYVELALRQTRAGDPLRGDLVEIQDAARRAMEITRQLLAFARKQTIQPIRLDLNGAIEASLRMLRRLVGEEIEIGWRPAPGLWSVRMDPTQVDQILANLCVNARDAIDGPGHVGIRTRNVTLAEGDSARPPELAPGDYVAFEVSDDGAGMGEETLAQIFEPFFSTKGAGKGTGLGLATVYGIVRQNEGHVRVRSAPGAGTTFEFLLPRAADGAEADALPLEAPPPQGRGEVILLVEDEPSLLQVGRRILGDLGYTVLAAGSPEEALRISAAHPGEVRLLITDVVMPKMNGRELAEALRAARPGLRCLFMSGYTADVIAHRGVLETGIDFVQKPFTVEGLAERTRAALDRP